MLSGVMIFAVASIIYVQKEKQPIVVATNRVGQTLAELAIELEMIRQLNQRFTVPV